MTEHTRISNPPVAPPVVPPEETDALPPRVPKKITCPRCNGDGVWHTSETGRRLAMHPGPFIDESKPCPKCKGKKKVIQWITQEQAEKEKAEKAAARKSAKAKIDAEARRAKAEIDGK